MDNFRIPCLAVPEQKKKNDAPNFVLSNYTLALEDCFDGEELDYNVWDTSFIWGPGLAINREEQYYVDTKNGDTTAPSPFSKSAAGNLLITASPIVGEKPVIRNGIEGGQNYSSGIITTKNHLCFSECYVETCVKVPCDISGAWLAAWLLNCFYYNNAAEKDSAEGIFDGTDKFNTEIDIAEWVNGENNSGDCLTSAYHYHTGDRQSDTNYKIWSLDPGNFREYNINTGETDSRFNVYEDCNGDLKFTLPPKCGNICGEFHTLGCHWTREFVRIYSDGVLINCIEGNDRLIFDQQMYFLMNFAVGGGYPLPSGALADPADYPASMEVEYVRIYTP